MKNPVAKNARKFNKGGPMRDRKKDDKRGYMKHKGKQLNSDAQQTDTTGHTNAAAKKPQNYVDPETGKTKTRMVPVHKDVQNEKLNPSQGIKAYIDDFQKSDAPQFKGKSDAKRKEMAIAAYLDAKRGEKKEACWDGYAQKGMKKKGDKMVPNCVPEAVDNRHLLKQLGQGIPKPSGGGARPGASKRLTKNMSAAQKAKQAAKIKKGLDREKRKDKPGMTKRSDDYTIKNYKSGAAGRYFSSRYEGIDELYYKVNVEGLPTMIVDAESPTKIKANFRKLFKNPDKVVQDVERVSTAEVQKHFRLKSQGKDDMDEGYNPRAAAAQRSAANKMYGRTSDSPSKPKTTSGLDSKGRMIRDKDPAASRRAAGALSKAIQKKYGSVKKEDAEARARLKLKHETEKERLQNRHAKEREAMKEATSKKLSDKRAELRKKMYGDTKYLTPAQRKELENAAKAALNKEREVKKAAPAPAKPVSKTSKGKVRTGSEEMADRNIFMQLRKAQDRGGNQAVTVSPTGKKVTLNPGQIDMILKRHDSLQKPDEKRKFKIMLIKSLRAKAK